MISTLQFCCRCLKYSHSLKQNRFGISINGCFCAIHQVENFFIYIDLTCGYHYGVDSTVPLHLEWCLKLYLYISLHLSSSAWTGLKLRTAKSLSQWVEFKKYVLWINHESDQLIWLKRVIHMTSEEVITNFIILL